MADVFSMVSPVILGLFLGIALDRWLGTSPLFTLILMFFGLATGFWSIIKQSHDK